MRAPSQTLLLPTLCTLLCRVPWGFACLCVVNCALESRLVWCHALLVPRCPAAFARHFLVTQALRPPVHRPVVLHCVRAGQNAVQRALKQLARDVGAKKGVLCLCSSLRGLRVTLSGSCSRVPSALRAVTCPACPFALVLTARLLCLHSCLQSETVLPGSVTVWLTRRPSLLIVLRIWLPIQTIWTISIWATTSMIWTSVRIAS